MPTKATFIRGFHPKIGAYLVPTSQDGQEMLAAMKADKEVLVNVHVPRNVRHHRMLFSLLNHVIEGGAWEGDTESLLDAIKIATGHVDRIFGMDGRPYYKTRSINFASMSQDQFKRFFDRAVYYVSTRLLGSDDWEALRDEIIEITEGDLGRRAREHAARFG